MGRCVVGANVQRSGRRAFQDGRPPMKPEGAADERLPSRGDRMRVWMNWLMLSTVIAVLGTSLALLASFTGVNSPWVSLLLMFDFLGVAKVAQPLFRLRMPKALHRVRRWERVGNVYRRLGVPGFGKLLRRAPLRYLNSAVYLARTEGDLSAVLLRAESGEAIHFWAAVLFTPYVMLAGVNRQWGVAAWFSLAQVLVNIYPILHLRHVRWRVTRTLRKIACQRVGDD
jgi:Glycosyl-4,4'-diaponeurosporenoate acyltransferase